MTAIIMDTASMVNVFVLKDTLDLHAVKKHVSMTAIIKESVKMVNVYVDQVIMENLVKK